MVYEFVIVVPADTKEYNPVKVDALLPPQVITHVEVEMAAGCHRLVHCVIVEGKHQIFPANPEGTMATDSHIIAFNTYYEMRRGNNLLLIKCWSPDTLYEHKVTVRFVVIPKSIASIAQVITLLERLLRGIGIIE